MQKVPTGPADRPLEDVVIESVTVNYRMAADQPDSDRPITTNISPIEGD